jgi:hypothetical protein
MYELDDYINTNTKDVNEIVECLEMQYNFLHFTEHTYRLYLQIKLRVDSFCNEHFLDEFPEYSTIEFYSPDFDVPMP